ncbi:MULTISPECIES: trimeric intracellular cation channel family protein [unclassified Luteococcus]|uniref:trimeric intracellular cation channel family protein n=1 Tax=unclassified Luteococcus TaxID=2639923 RepID=UPI00313E2EC6
MVLLDFVGVFAFALSGGLVGVRRHFDIFGILTLAVVTALGGGIVRDLLLGITPPSNITNLPLFCTALAAGMITFYSERPVSKLRRTVLVADAVGLGAFCVTGTLTAIHAGHPGMEAVMVGVITAVGGGVLRDVLAGQVPSVFSPELYALPALLGSLLTDAAARLDLTSRPVIGHPLQWVLMALVCGLRLAAIRFGWHSPTPRRPERD